MKRQNKHKDHSIIETSDWLEFKSNNGVFVNIKKSEIEYVSEVTKSTSSIGLKSGSTFIVNMRYSDVMELV